VHNSGSGSTAVNAAGSHGDASQNADQHESDNATHTNYEDSSSSDSHDTIGSHNDSSYDNSHDYESHH
jgi:hypothetical protein